jgi:hypothetical protein
MTKPKKILKQVSEQYVNLSIHMAPRTLAKDMRVLADKK